VCIWSNSPNMNTKMHLQNVGFWKKTNVNAYVCKVVKYAYLSTSKYLTPPMWQHFYTPSEHIRLSTSSNVYDTRLE